MLQSYIKYYKNGDKPKKGALLGAGGAIGGALYRDPYCTRCTSDGIHQSHECIHTTGGTQFPAMTADY